MRSIKKTDTHPLRKALIIIGVLVVLVVTYVVTAYSIRLWPFNTGGEQSIQSSSDANTGDKKSTDSNTVVDDTPVPGTTNTTKDTPVDSGASQSSGTVTITAASQGQGSDSDMLHIRVLISGVESSGTCTLSLTKNSSAITLTSSIQPGPSTSTCQGFDVSISGQQLSVGEWVATISVKSGSIAASASQKVYIQ